MGKVGLLPKAGLIPLAAGRIAYRLRSPWLQFRRGIARRIASVEPGFFDAYPRFYSTSYAQARPNRLNRRYEVMIAANAGLIRGQSVLDIASHDGRWSLAAQKTGAREVLGIEARAHLVNAARESLRMYQVPAGAVRFIQGDIFEQLDQLEPARFDTVFCFGFFYHTMHHMLLLNKIARLKPNYLICDTEIDLDPDAIVKVHAEGVEKEYAGAFSDAGAEGAILVGHPSQPALELMLKHAGFDCRFLDWRSFGIRRWDGLKEYHDGSRVTLVAKRKGS